MRFYRVDLVTGEAMDEIYYLRQRLQLMGPTETPGKKHVRDLLNALKSQRHMKALESAGVTSEDALRGIWRRKRWKRSDVSSLMVVACVQAYSFRAFEVLCETYPEKVVYRAFERDNNRGYLGCGTSTIRSWLEPAGRDLISFERNKVIC